MTLPLIVCTAVCILLILPGVALARWTTCFSGCAEAIAIGAVAGLAATILCGYFLLLAGLPAVVFVAAEYLALGWLLLARSPARTARDPQPRSHVAGWMILAGLVFLSRSIPLFFGDVPPGIDPSFHCLIAQTILDSRTIPFDWRPYETVSLHYPVGTHILVAEIARLTTLPVDVVFKALFPFLSTLTTVAVHATALRWSRDRRIAWYSALAYSFLPVWGNLDYYRWGGLPNQLGMLVLLALVDVTLMPASASSAPLFALLFAALAIVHHHSTACAVIVLGGYATFLMLLQRQLVAPARTAIHGLLLGICLALVPLAATLHGASDFGQTSVLRFDEPLIPIGNAVVYIGIPLAAIGTLGVIELFRRPSSESDLLLAFWIVALFGAFVLLEYVYRFGVYVWKQEFYTALTPSRFLTDLAYPLAIAAGAPLADLARQSKLRAAPAIALVAALAWSFLPIREQCLAMDPTTDVAALRWVASHSPRDALIVSTSPWAPYLARREGAYTPLPASEARGAECVREKRALLEADLATLSTFSERARRPLYVIAPAPPGAPAGARVVHRSDRSVVYEIAGSGGMH